MNISLIASIKKKDDFFNAFKDGDQNRLHNGNSLIMYSVGNTDLDARYEISNFLIDKGVDVESLNAENESVLHLLLGHNEHELERTIELCKRFISLGVNINTLDKFNRVALQYIINMKYSDEQLRPLYDLWFSQEFVELEVPNKWGLTPIDLARKLPYRKEFYERMLDYVQKK